MDIGTVWESVDHIMTTSDEEHLLNHSDLQTFKVEISFSKNVAIVDTS